MLRRSEKAEVVEGLVDRFRRQKVSIFADIRGISVAKLSQFRRDLRAASADFKVAKKTLLRRALDAVGPATSGGLDPKPLEGEIGVIFGYGDQVAPARVAAKFAKENETFKVLKAILDGKIIEAKEALGLAKLPPREVLLAEVARAMQSPIRGLAVVLQGNIRNLVVVLNQIISAKERI